MGPSADFHIASIAVLSLVFLYVTFGRRGRQGRQFKLFVALFVSTVLLVVCGLARGIVVMGLGVEQAAAPFRAAVTVLQCVASCFMLAYTASLCRSEGRGVRFERVALTAIPFILATCATISSLFTDSVFYVDSDGFLSPGPLHFAVHLCMAFYPAMCIVYAIAYRKMLRTLDAAAVWCASILVLICVCVETLNPQIRLASFGFAMAVLSVFVTAGSPFEFVDSLTHAFDVSAFRAHVAELLKGGRRFSVVVIALRRLPMLNALLGTQVADEAIKLCAQAAVHAGRTRQVYRVRGSAFAFVTFSRRESRRVTEELTKLFARPQQLGGTSMRLEVAVASASGLDAFDSSEDIAQYVGFLIDKLQEGVEVPEEQRGLIEEFRRRREVRRYLAHAVNEGLVSTYAQPLYSLEQNRFCGFEALSRLEHPTLGAIPPDEFIDAAESEGLIAELGRTQFDAVCRFASEHADELAAAHIDAIKVNLSPVELMEADFGLNTLMVMERWGVSPALFQFEITETASTRYGFEAGDAIKTLRDAGSRFCMDDFGSGFANLDSILSLPFSVVKIDRTLLAAAVEGDSARALYSSVVEMVKSQGLVVVAEGVETAQQDAFVRSLGVEEAQGFFYAHPVPIGDVFATIHGTKSNG